MPAERADEPQVDPLDEGDEARQAPAAGETQEAADEGPPPGAETLETPRLLLRAWRDDDRAPFAVMNADEAVTRYLSGPMTRQQSDALVDHIIAHWWDWGYGLYAVERRSDGRFIGFVGLSHHRALPADVEIGWRLARPVWGDGLATEAAMVVRDHAFGDLGIPRLIAVTTDENLASRRVMDKLGMTFDRYVAYDRWRLRVHELRA